MVRENIERILDELPRKDFLDLAVIEKMLSEDGVDFECTHRVPLHTGETMFLSYRLKDNGQEYQATIHAYITDEVETAGGLSVGVDVDLADFSYGNERQPVYH